MDLSALTQNYTIFVIVGICLCVGYIIKNIVPGESVDKFIPLIMGILGLILNIWIHHGVSPDVILGGMWSGLASTGLHQVFKQLIKKGEHEQQ